MILTDEHLGEALAISGAAISAAATVINNCLLLHTLAMQVWFLSNPIMLAYFVGLRLKKWNGGISLDAMIVLYAFYILTNAYGVIQTI
jgi:hypothetical protein